MAMDKQELKPELKKKIYETIGAASMCWEKPEGAGEFQSTWAKKLGDDLCRVIDEHTLPKPKGLIEAVKFFFKHAWKGAIMYSIQYAYQSFIMWLGFLLFYPLPYLSCVGIFIVLRMFRSGVVTLKPTNHYKPEALKQIEG